MSSGPALDALATWDPRELCPHNFLLSGQVIELFQTKGISGSRVTQRGAIGLAYAYPTNFADHRWPEGGIGIPFASREPSSRGCQVFGSKLAAQAQHHAVRGTTITYHPEAVRAVMQPNENAVPRP